MSSATRGRIKRFLKRLILVGVASILGLTLFVYSIDFLVFRYRLSRNLHPYGEFTVNAYDAVPQKSGKTEFIFHPPQVQTCSNSLFPRAGFTPCWYLQGHTEQRTDF